MKTKRAENSSLRRLKRSGATLAVTAALLAFLVAAALTAKTPAPPAVPASAIPESGVVYAISYDAAGGLALMRSDIEYIKKLGLRFILPGRDAGGGMVLIADGRDPEELARMLRQTGARAVFVMRKTMAMADAEAAVRYADEGLFALAAPVPACADPVRFFAEAAASGAELMRLFGRRIDIFVLEIPGGETPCTVSCGAGFGLTTVFIFGNGRNEPPFPQSGVAVMNRAARLPEWTIAEFFSEIAVLFKSHAYPGRHAFPVCQKPSPRGEGGPLAGDEVLINSPQANIIPPLQNMCVGEPDMPGASRRGLSSLA